MSDNGLATFTKACGCMMDSRTNTLVDACKFHAAWPGPPGVVTLDTKPPCDGLTGDAFERSLLAKPHLALRVKLGALTKQPYWAITKPGAPLKSVRRWHVTERDAYVSWGLFRD